MLVNNVIPTAADPRNDEIERIDSDREAVELMEWIANVAEALGKRYGRAQEGRNLNDGLSRRIKRNRKSKYANSVLTRPCLQHAGSAFLFSLEFRDTHPPSKSLR